MSFADELRNKTSSYDPEQIRKEKIRKHIEECIRECVRTIKERCEYNADKGRNSISGYLNVSRDYEYGYSVSANMYEDKSYEKSPRPINKAPKFDFGGRKIAKSGKEQKSIAEEIQYGIYNELKDCGFTSLDIEIIKRNNPEDSSFLGIGFSHIYSIYVSIKW